MTDVLVTRGNREVVHSAASNSGARLSEFGCLKLIKRSETDSILAENLGLRTDIPRHLFQQMIAKASDDVRKKLELEYPAMAAQVQALVSDVTGAMQSKFGPASKVYFAAKKAVAIHPRAVFPTNSGTRAKGPSVLQLVRNPNMSIITLTKQAPMSSSNAAPVGDGAPELVKNIARMVSEWEMSDELPTEFAQRVVDLVSFQIVPNLVGQR